MMKIEANNELIKLFSREDINQLSSQPVPSEFITLLKTQIVTRDRCFYFDFLAPEGGYSKQFANRTGNEATYNKLLINYYFQNDDFIQRIRVGIIFSFHLYIKLNTELNGEFEVLLSGDENFCGVTFYKRRKNEIYIEDLNKLTLELALRLSPLD